MMKNRPPYDAEVDAEVAKEYERLQEEKRRARPDHGREIEAVRTRVSDLEGTVTRPCRERGRVPQTHGGHDAKDSSKSRPETSPCR